MRKILQIPSSSIQRGCLGDQDMQGRERQLL